MHLRERAFGRRTYTEIYGVPCAKLSLSRYNLILENDAKLTPLSKWGGVPREGGKHSPFPQQFLTAVGRLAPTPVRLARTR